MTKTQPQIFTIWSDEVEGRIDSFYYQPEFINLVEKLKKVRNYKLADLITDLSGGATPKIAGDFYMESSGIQFLRVQNITEEGINLDDVKFIKPEVHEKYLRRSQLKRDDIVFTITGRIGTASVVPDNFEGNINQHSVRFHLKDEIDEIKILPQYIAIYFNSEIGKKLSLRDITGGTRPALDYEAVKSIKIPIPPPEIQNQIVEIMQKAYGEKRQKETEAEKLLGTIDDYVLAELGIEMPEIKKEMVFEVWSDKIENNRFDANYWQPFFEEIKKAVSKGKYKTQKLKNFITKIHYGASTSNAYVDEGIPLLRIQNLKPNFLNLSEVVNLPESFRKELGNGFVKTGDMLISRSGTVGVVSVVPKEANGFAFGSFMIKFCLNAQINKEFVSIWLNNNLNKLLIEREKIGAIQGNITIGTIENFDVPSPPLSVQNKIAEDVKLRMQKSERLKNEAKEVLEKAKEKVEAMIL